MDSNNDNPRLHLFVDDHELVSRSRVERVIGRPRKHPAPVVQQDRPWESPWIYAWGSVLRCPDSGRLRMWYGTTGAGSQLAFQRTCYAESGDGIHWEKPTLGLYEALGFKDTNIMAVTAAVHSVEAADSVMGECGARRRVPGPGLEDFATHLDGVNVVLDPSEPDPQKRYKFLGCLWRNDDQGGHSHNLLSSPDGIHWNMPPEKLMQVNDGTTVEWDPIRKVWMLGWLSSQVIDSGENVRYAELSESPDLRAWTPVGKPFELDEEDDYGRALQGHFLHPFVYGDQYLGFYSAIHSKEGWVQTYLVTSRDGRSWERPLRRDPLIGLGAEGQFDEDSVDTAINSPILIGDDLYIYYCGRARRHWAGVAATGAIGLARLKRDRFAGLANGGWFNRDCNNNVSNDGEVVTRPVSVTGPMLYINARSRQVPRRTLIPDASLSDFEEQDLQAGDLWGTVRVELLDENQDPIPGYSLEECHPIRDDAVRIPVRWQSREDVEELEARTICVRFRLNMATLYAYTFDERPVETGHAG
jgi:hypothetical protein